MKRRYFIYTLLLVISSLCHASGNISSNWISFGLGSSINAFPEDHSELSGSISYQFQVKKNTILIQSIYNTEYYSGGDTPNPNLSISHTSIILSRYINTQKGFFLSLGTGPSYNRFIERGKLRKENWPSASIYDKIISDNFGANLITQVIFFSSHVGFGISAYRNVNTKRSFTGYLFRLDFGEFRGFLNRYK